MLDLAQPGTRANANYRPEAACRERPPTVGQVMPPNVTFVHVPS
jgi:hypothetical protein